MSIPTGAFVVADVAANPTSPDDLGRTDKLIDYERGGIALNDPGQGLNVLNWRVQVIGDEVRVSPEPYSSDTLLFSGAEITEASLAFDQNMRPVVAYVQAGVTKLWWYDSSIPGQTVTTYSNSRSPFLTMDDKREIGGGQNDILMFYLKGTADLYYRRQRDRYNTEFFVCTFARPINQITRVGLGRGLRLQIEVESS